MAGSDPFAEPRTRELNRPRLEELLALTGKLRAAGIREGFPERVGPGEAALSMSAWGFFKAPAPGGFLLSVGQVADYAGDIRDCGTTACLGGYAAFHHPFNEQGLVSALTATRRKRFLDGVDTAMLSPFTPIYEREDGAVFRSMPALMYFFGLTVEEFYTVFGPANPPSFGAAEERIRNLLNAPRFAGIAGEPRAE